MKVFLALMIFFGLSSYAQADVYVRGYHKSNGTYVQPYHRSNPDGNPYNNYGYDG